MRRDIDTDKLIGDGNLPAIEAWLTEKLHQYGSLKTPDELITGITGEELNAQYFVDYLQKKYTALYEL
jgi:carboxypeptidase Taq